MPSFGHHTNFKSLVQHFTPNWFAVNMGTGITAICLGNLPWQPEWLHTLSLCLWAFNGLLFAIFFTIWLSSLIFFPHTHLVLLKHSSLPFFLGCLPMGLVTVINGFVLFGIPWLGQPALNIAQILWIFDAFLSIAVVLVVPYFMFTEHRHELSSTTAIWLLPCVAAEVAAASAATIALHLPSANAQIFLILGYLLWGISLPLAFAIIVMFLQRLILYKVPPVELGATIWLLVGPIGTGAFGLMNLGEVAQLCAHNSQLEWMSSLYSLGLAGGIVLTGFGTWIVLISCFLTLRYCFQGIRYNMSFWGFTFPLGTYIMAILTLGRQLESGFLMGIGSILTGALVLIWIFVFYKTLPGLLRGYLIQNPTIPALKDKHT